MSALRAMMIMTVVTVTMIISVALFNYRIDPMCYYCGQIDLSKKTANFYYQAAQKVIAHPETQLIILGSSRGQTTSPQWIERRTGLKTLNLSLGAAEMTAKIAFLNLALQKTKLKKVLWFADYFELITENADSKIRNTPALQAYLSEDLGPPNLKARASRLLELIDHNTLEASFYTFTKGFSENHLDQGAGSGINFDECGAPAFKGNRSVLQLEKEAGQTYDSYSRRVLKPPQSQKAWQLFVEKLKELDRLKIDVLIVIPPYYPNFAKRLEEEFPELYKNHRLWIKELEKVTVAHVKVLNYFEGIPQDDGTPRFWNDGVHFTCKGVISMLGQKLWAP